MVNLFLSLVAQVLHAALMLAAAPLLTGVAQWMEARLTGRVGSSVLQPWRDLLRLVRKQSVIAENVSILFRVAPAIAFAAVGAAAMLVPSFTLGMAGAPAADLLVVAGLLLASRVVLALAALDTGTAFGGIGASRTMLVTVCAEPALLTIFLAFAAAAGSSNIGAIVASLGDAGGMRVSLALALPALVCVVAAESGRLDPGSEIGELGTVDAALAVEYSARELALLQTTAALRRLVWLSLIVVLFIPFGVAPIGASPAVWLPALAIWAVKLCLLTAVLAVFGAMRASMRLARVPAFLGVALLLALLAAALVLAGQAAA